MNNKKKLILCVVLAILVIVGISLGLFIILEEKNNKGNITNNEIDDNSVIENGTNTIDDGTNLITKEEIKTLYNYVKASLKSNNVCLGYFYQNPFSNHTSEDKISLVLINYASKYSTKITDEIIQKISEEDRQWVLSDQGYIEAKYVKEGLEKLYNIKVGSFENGKHYWYYKYYSDIAGFVSGDGGGNYPADIIQKIINYSENDEEISITEVKAEVLSYDMTYSGENGTTVQYAGIYRYANNNNTLVFKGNINDFEFNEENISKLPQIKYIFKKNDNGNYYLSDIVNLNYQEDYAECKKQSN